MVERISTVSCHVNVRQPIVVIVTDRDTHAPALSRQSSGLRDVSEFKLGVLVIERDQGIAAPAEMFNG